MELPSARDCRFMTEELAIESALLMRVLSITKGFHLFELERQQRGKFCSAARALSVQITANRAVVASRMLEDLVRELEAHVGRDTACAQGFHNPLLISWIHHDDDIGMGARS